MDEIIKWALTIVIAAATIAAIARLLLDHRASNRRREAEDAEHKRRIEGGWIKGQLLRSVPKQPRQPDVDWEEF